MAERLGLKTVGTPDATTRSRIAPRWVKDRLLAGDSVLASFLQTPCVATCETVAEAGFDLLCVEAEHSALGPHQVQLMVGAVSQTGVPCLVRVCGNDPVAVATALDAGAVGVVVPRVEKGSQALAAFRAARFPPAGFRGVGPGRASSYGSRIGQYVAEANDQTLVCVQIETRDGVENVDDIARTPVDLLLVGPGDLAYSYGLVGQAGAQSLHSIIDHVLRRAISREKLTGIYATTPEEAARWIEFGVTLVVLSSDLALLRTAAEHAAVAARAATSRGCQVE